MKVPAGNIPLGEAFQRYYQWRWANAPSLEGLAPLDRLKEEVLRSGEAQRELEEPFASGTLEARVHDEVREEVRELTITPGQWKDTCSPARAFFGGPIEDCPDGSLAEYRGLFPYTDEGAFKKWLRSRDNFETPKTAGRPSSMGIVKAEFERRRAAGMCKSSRKAEANALAEWLSEARPGVTQLASKTIRNKLPRDFQPFRAPK